MENNKKLKNLIRNIIKEIRNENTINESYDIDQITKNDVKNAIKILKKIRDKADGDVMVYNIERKGMPIRPTSKSAIPNIDNKYTYVINIFYMYMKGSDGGMSDGNAISVRFLSGKENDTIKYIKSELNKENIEIIPDKKNYFQYLKK